MRLYIRQLPNYGLPRGFHAFTPAAAQLQRKPIEYVQNALHRPLPPKDSQKISFETRPAPKFVKRNALGVQMLSRTVHEQVFKNCSFPPPPKIYTNIALEHLAAHDLDPSQSSKLPSTEFTLPPIQGNNLLEHFHRIGNSVSEPYKQLADTFAESELPPRPEYWDIQAGWTKYIHNADGSGYSEHVPYPMHNGKPETMLCFDVETLPNYHKFPIMACAASPNAWYAWISPWILDPSSTVPEHLAPLGPPDIPRVVVGHNVSYDRQRILEEYHVNGTQNRFLDTMALHVAVKGISSHQRPAWMKHRKNKEEDKIRHVEAIEAIVTMLHDIQEQLDVLRRDGSDGSLEDVERRTQLVKQWQVLQSSLPSLQASADTASDSFTPGPPPGSVDIDEDGSSQKGWEDLTAMNSLVDVAKLYCDIDISKEIRNDFMTCTPEEILAGITDYLTYCASDVFVTHSVYRKVLPGFSSSCPHPVSFAGMLAMGSGFLPVNEQWEAYLASAEGVWRKLERGVKDGLESLAREALAAFDPDVEGQFDDDPWLSQLDWTPKTIGKSRGLVTEHTDEETQQAPPVPLWYSEVLANPLGKKSYERILPLLLQLSYQGSTMLYNNKEKWHFVSSDGPDESEVVRRLPSSKPNLKTSAILSPRHSGIFLKSGDMSSCDPELAERICSKDTSDEVKDKVLQLAKTALDSEMPSEDPWLSQLDWAETDTAHSGEKPKKKSKSKPVKPPAKYWPKWFWELSKPKKDMPPGSLDITMKNRFSPLLLKMSWHGYPLFHSREYGWTFRVPTPNDGTEVDPKLRHLKPLEFLEEADAKLTALIENGFTFYKLPHKDGEHANVGSPLSKAFFGFASDGTLRSGAGDAAKEMVDVGVQCSYWVSARDRVLNQMVGWQDLKEKKWDMGLPAEQDAQDVPEGQLRQKWGMILPQVITMGTVTRRAIEKTWLTASNAKKNRVGSELKAMVRAPQGYSIVGADVDSEELWISSCMGDAQFGLHGATAIGWMTLEGTKSSGTDLHSKTASILGISRDQAKVFNYSRIYGAGMRHAMLLLQQSNSSMLQEEAQKLAQNLYTSTKGKNTHRTDMFGRKFWYGGTESFVFNKLEEIALSDFPQTPALGCGVTQALSKANLPQGFGSDYMPSRINWVVQSSGVDYLHLLIVSMNHLIREYGIEARYLISVHDELRYLVKDEDRYRAALALQIANLWTRSMFAFKLGMDDLPQGVAFFSAVDVDHVLRKEVDMTCVTPSQPNPIPPGEILDIEQVLEKTKGGSLWPDGRPMTSGNEGWKGSLEGYVEPDCLTHRAPNPSWLRAQATNDFGEVKHLAKQVHGSKVGGTAEGGVGDGRKRARKLKRRGVGNGEGVDWSEWIDQIQQSGQQLNLW